MNLQWELQISRQSRTEVIRSVFAQESNNVWRPRRNLKRLDEKRPEIPVYKFRQIKQDKEDVQQVGQVLQNIIPRNNNQDLSMSMSASGMQNRIHIQRNEAVLWQGQGRKKDSIGIIILLLLGVVVLLIALKDRILSFFNAMQRGNREGKWVLDRSLGGKMIFVPAADTQKKIEIKQEAIDSGLRKLRYKEGSAWAAAVVNDNQQQQIQQGIIPNWWSVPLGNMYVSESSRERCRKEAEMCLKKLQTEKLTRAEDYSPFLILEMYRWCKEGGNIVLQSGTANSRESVYRAAVEIAIDEAMALGKQSELKEQFIGGISECLGIEEKKAIEICLGCIAAKTRAKLLASIALIRANNQLQHDYQAIFNLFQIYPLTLHMPQTQMIGQTLENATTVQERQYLLQKLIQDDEIHKEVYAVMLGFQPKLVFGEGQG